MYASIAVLAFCTLVGPASADEAKLWGWAPYPVNAWENGKATEKNYELLKPEEVKKKWHLCVLMPTLTDSVFIGINYAFVTEAKRLGLKMTIFDAGGFQNLTKQIAQYDNCVALGADGYSLPGDLRRRIETQDRGGQGARHRADRGRQHGVAADAL
jgi:protein TorT